MEIPSIPRGISTSVVQRYKISERNANLLTLVNTNIISHFSAFFASEKGDNMAFIVIKVKRSPNGSTSILLPLFFFHLIADNDAIRLWGNRGGENRLAECNSMGRGLTRRSSVKYWVAVMPLRR